MRVGRNNTRTAWVLKLDIKKFFASIDHKVLLDILDTYITDRGVLLLLEKVVKSFSAVSGKGLPLGNLTSQLFCNVYMNEFDQFVKHKLKVKYYIRYADDFVLLSDDRQYLLEQIKPVSEFLQYRLGLSLHPDKIFLKTLASGVDFLGWVHFSRHRVLRTITKRRALKRLRIHPVNETLQSYLGLTDYGNAFLLQQESLNLYGLFSDKSKN